MGLPRFPSRLPEGWKRLGPAAVALLLASGPLLLHSSCGTGDEFNLWRPVTAGNALKTESKAQLDQARVDLDDRKYSDAANLLAPIVNDSSRDSDEARILYVSANLGAAGLEIWSAISDIIATLDAESKQRTAGGIDEVLNLLGTSVLGTGTTRTSRIAALNNGIATLQHAPDPGDSQVQSVTCIVAAFLAPPTIQDATAAVQEVQNALTQIQAAAQSGGTVCPNIGLLDTASTDVQTASKSINAILDAAKGCTFLDLSQATASVNQITSALKKLTAQVDKGCSLPTCPASVPNCLDYFPTCVQQALASDAATAKAGDGIISSCELILNCSDPTQCFSSFQ
jgi:hypothetical protein